MWKTVLLLIFTIIVVPFVAFKFDDPLSVAQESTLVVLVAVYLFFALGAFIISSISKNYSQVDKLWSVIPIIYAGIVCYYSGFEPRIVLMAVLVLIWGARLTYNFSRRGGYSLKFWEGDEDYRWAILRAKPEVQAPWKWTLFNLFFISLYQMGLILLFTLPILKSMDGSALGIFDIVLAALFVGFVIIETMADQQQWKYQNEKHKALKSGLPISSNYQKGFTHTGLWSIVRHPNYAAEQAIWIVFYFFSVIATGHWLNWSVVGCLLLVLLFKGSSDFSEEISAKKYPSYADYQKKTPRFIPFLK